MKVEVHHRPYWHGGLYFHIWLTGSVAEIKAAHKWVTEYTNREGIWAVVSGPENLFAKHNTVRYGQPIGQRLIIQSNKPIDALLLKLSVV